MDPDNDIIIHCINRKSGSLPLPVVLFIIILIFTPEHKGDDFRLSAHAFPGKSFLFFSTPAGRPAVKVITLPVTRSAIDQRGVYQSFH